MSYDQLNLELLKEIHEKIGSIGILLIESEAKGRSRPYHKQKLAFVLSNLRHFALEVQSSGYQVRYIVSQEDYSQTLSSLRDELGVIHCIEHAERSTRVEVQQLVEEGDLIVHPHSGWLTPQAWFTDAVGRTASISNGPILPICFGRKLDGLCKMVSQWVGKYSFDEATRHPWKGDPPAPSTPIYEVDEIDDEVALIIDRVFSEHPGRVDLSQLPTSSADIEQARMFAVQCLPHFGTYEDAMSTESRGLFHTRLASLINLHRIMPMQAIHFALESTAELNNVEGFLRQLIWREYVHHIHAVTDGFRTIEVNRSLSRRDANWFKSAPLGNELHPNHLEQTFPLPQAYWGQKSGLACLDGLCRFCHGRRVDSPHTEDSWC